MRLSFAAAVFCSAVAASAQSVGVTAVLQQPATITAVSPVTTVTQTFPAGTPLGPLVVMTSAPVSLGAITGSSTVTATGVSVTLSESCVVSTAGGSSSVGPVDLLCSLTATAPVHVRFELDWALTAPPGTPLPTVAADVGNDGVFESTGIQPNTTRVLGAQLLGAAPLPVLLRMQTSGTAGSVASRATLRVLPALGELIQTFSMECGIASLTGLPTFDGALQLHFGRLLPLEFLVAGLGVSPVALPTPIAGLPPCLLMPTPDAIAPISVPTLSLPMASLRGVMIWVQGVGFATRELHTTQTLRVLFP